jgi:hypothetical protein
LAEFIVSDWGKDLLTEIKQIGSAVQAGTPMTATKEAGMCVKRNAMSVSPLWCANIPAGGMKSMRPMRARDRG